MARTVMMWRSSRSGTPALGAEMERAGTEQSLSRNVSLLNLVHIKDQSRTYANSHVIFFLSLEKVVSQKPALSDACSIFVPRFTEKPALKFV